MINTMIKLATHNNQKSDDSLLWKNIQLVLDCSEEYAKKMALSHCNAFSFYGCLLSRGIISDNYIDYFKKGHNQKIWQFAHNITDKGFIRDKDKLCSAFGIDYDYENKMIKDWLTVLKCDIDHDKAYQVRIKTGIRSKHFIMCAVKNGMLHIYDTWDENLIDVPIFKRVNEKNFEALMEV